MTFLHGGIDIPANGGRIRTVEKRNDEAWQSVGYDKRILDR